MINASNQGMSVSNSQSINNALTAGSNHNLPGYAMSGE